MSFAYVSSPGLPGIRPRNFSGEGTVSDAGMWSTSSVVMRGSCRYSLMSLVYSSSIFCGAAADGAAAAALPFLPCPLADGAETRASASRLPPKANRIDMFASVTPFGSGCQLFLLREHFAGALSRPPPIPRRPARRRDPAADQQCRSPRKRLLSRKHIPDQHAEIE